jgi:hypothetical protein
MTLSPALQLNVSYDSNVTHRSQELVDQYGVPILASGVFEYRPSLGLTYKNDSLKLQALYELQGRQFLASTVSSLSYRDQVATLEADILPDSRIGMVVRDDFNVRHYTTPSEGALTRTYNNLLVEGRYSPGSALDLNLGLHYFADQQNQIVGSPTKHEGGAQLRGKWRFFPRTALLAEANFAQGYWANLAGCGEAACQNKSDSVTQWSVLGGIAGQFTEAIQASLFLGYGNLYNSGKSGEAFNVEGVDGILGQTQVVFTPIETQNLSLGFTRRFGDSARQDYAIYNSFSLGYNGIYFGRLTASAAAAFDIRFQNSADSTDLETRTDRVVSALIGADYQITRWLTAKASFSPNFTFSAPNDLSSEEAGYYSLSFSYTEYVASVGLRGIY